MSIGLATTILESQLHTFTAMFFYSGSLGVCHTITGGGAIKLVSVHYPPTFSPITGHVQIFFDSLCHSLFIDETATLISLSATTALYSFPATLSVYSKAGAKAATLTLANKISKPNTTDIKLAGTGTLTPTGTTAKIAIGLNCQIPFNDSLSTKLADAVGHSAVVAPSATPPRNINCVEGVAQNFPLIGKSVASVTPLTLHLVTTGNITKVTFQQTTPAKLSIGAPNALSIALNASGVVLVTGAHTAYGTDSLTGQAADFILFPPTPTFWSIVDAGHNAKFSIAVTDNATRKLAGKVTAASGAPTLATIAVDQSGTGTITYSNAVKQAISAWGVRN